MKYSGIGGPEGVMMKNKSRYAVAVRKPDQEIVVETTEYAGMIKNEKIRNIPLVRGVVQFVESLVIGVRSLTFSASFFEEEEDIGSKDGKKEEFMTGATVAVSLLLAVGIFMVLPYGVSLLLGRSLSSRFAVTVLEGILRLLIFIGYVAAISLMPDIKRVYMYHGAEHKCINCIEHGMDLNVENVRKSSRQHKRCGTSFLLIVMFISILIFMLLQMESKILRFLLRLLLLPVIAGVSYEFIRLAGRSESRFVGLLSKPGLLLQKITTREPDDAMIEVAIASVEAVFDWKAFLEEPDGKKP